MLTGRSILIAVILGIALVFGLAGWRFFHGETEQAAVPLAVRPAVPTAKAVAPVMATAETAAPKDQAADLTQQFLIDDLQVVQGRVARQDAEIRRLRAELEALGQKYETLSAFASTAKEARPVAAAEPPPKKRKRRVIRLAKKR